jgi:hypothetical protein
MPSSSSNPHGNSSADATPSFVPNDAMQSHEAPPSPSPNGDNGRDSKGRFTRGNRGGPGNPFARKVADLRNSLLAEVTVEDIQKLVRMLLEKARGGDVSAAKLLLAYTIGRPAAAVDPDTLEIEEWIQFSRSTVTSRGMMAILNSLPAEKANAMVRTLWPLMTQAASAECAEALREMDLAEARANAEASRAKSTTPEQPIDHPAAADVTNGHATVSENDHVDATGVLEGVGENGHGVKGARVVRGSSQRRDGNVLPELFGEWDVDAWAKRIAEQVAENLGLGGEQLAVPIKQSKVGGDVSGGPDALPIQQARDRSVGV